MLLLKMGEYVIHHGAVGIARSLGRLGIPVYAIVEDRYTPLAMCRHLAGTFVNPSTDTNGVLSCLTAIAETIKRPTILLPTDDNAAVFIAEHSKDLADRFLFPRLRPELPRQLADKMSLYSLCRQLGIPFPDFVYPTSIDDVHKFLERVTFPVVVKAAEHSRSVNNRYSSLIARNPDELIAICGPPESFRRSKIVLQEYIPGEDWVFHGYRNPETDSLLGFTGRKVRSYPPFAGPTTLGVSIPNEQLSKQAEVMLREIGYAGVMDLDWRHDERDGRYKLVDFNPRVGANFRMFENSEGVDVVRALHLDLTGRPLRQSAMVEGRTFTVELYDLVASLAYLRRGGSTSRAWRKSLTGPRELAWWSWDDPLPFFAMGARLLLRVAGRTARRNGGKVLLHVRRANRILDFGARSKKA
ncbi:putative ATP-grasp superfamily ATP-dependent carboligase [Bradyrhizobium sp. cir1]|nr:putative ATP-grasp superfamily ATP-dependent carboligase [Bradyrhizobium sp. cir1]